MHFQICHHVKILKVMNFKLSSAKSANCCRCKQTDSKWPQKLFLELIVMTPSKTDLCWFMLFFSYQIIPSFHGCSFNLEDNKLLCFKTWKMKLLILKEFITMVSHNPQNMSRLSIKSYHTCCHKAACKCLEWFLIGSKSSCRRYVRVPLSSRYH